MRTQLYLIMLCFLGTNIEAMLTTQAINNPAKLETHSFLMSTFELGPACTDVTQQALKKMSLISFNKLLRSIQLCVLRTAIGCAGIGLAYQGIRMLCNTQVEWDKKNYTYYGRSLGMVVIGSAVLAGSIIL